MATFSRLYLFLFFLTPTPPYPTHHLEGNSGVILHCSGREQSSPFMHANMGIREMKKEEGVEDEGDSVGRGELLVGGQGSAFSARK